MQSRLKISIIIPVYNTDRFLEDCIQSILGQSLKELEIILVDDGSTDNSPQIIQSYADKHANIIGLQQDNQGQGTARNLGLSAARGDFIAFVDSDDVIPSGAYEEMYSLAVRHQSDMVVGIQQSFNDKRTWRNVPVHRKYFNQTVINTDIEQSPYLLEDISCCNRLIRHDLIKQHMLQFPATAREDLDFTARLFLLSSTISILPKVVYHYRGRIGSDTGTILSTYFHDWVNIIEDLKTVFKTCGREQLFPVLLRSEVHKLVVQSRFTKIVRNTAYSERMTIFQLLSSLAQQLTKQDISGSGMFSHREQVRVFMLQQEEYESLEMFEKKPWTPAYLTFLQKRESYQKISEPLLRIYMQEISALNRDRKLNIRVRFPKLLKGYEQVSKPYRRWGQALRRKRKANIPLSALFYYFALFPLVRIQNLISDNKQVWLIDERLSRSAEDNGFFLFQHLRNQYPKLKVYYVISADSPDRERVEKLGQVIYQYSVAHAYYLLQAKVLLSTDSFISLAFPFEIFRRLWGRTHNVFLQHGVAGNKRLIYSKKNYPYFSQIITTNEIEKKFFATCYKYDKNMVSTTGIARFDNLDVKRSLQRNKQILVVSTWREWLKTSTQIETSHFFWAWNQLLTSLSLLEILNEYKVNLLFWPHFRMKKKISICNNESPHIKIIEDLNLPMYKFIKDCDLLITDYSSIMYDFFYQEKPTICYMFDIKQWENQDPGPLHINLRTDLPADIAETGDNVIESLRWYLENNFIMKQEHKPRVDKFFKYRDDNNCERIYQAVCRATENIE